MAATTTETGSVPAVRVKAADSGARTDRLGVATPAVTSVPPIPLLRIALPDVDEVRAGEAAFQRLVPLMDELNEDDLPRINLDLVAAIISALGAQSKIAELRPEIVAQLPRYDLTLFDAFGDIVAALRYVDSVVRAASEERGDVLEKAQALDVKRTRLYHAALALTHFGLLDEKPLDSIKTQVGYKPLVRDVTTLVQLFEQNWQQVQGKVPFTLKELRAIDGAALAFGTAVGLRQSTREVPREIALRRRKVFALFRQAVTQIRRAASYLRGEAAVNDIVPTFSNGGRSARRGAAPNHPEQTPVTTPFAS